MLRRVVMRVRRHSLMLAVAVVTLLGPAVTCPARRHAANNAAIQPAPARTAQSAARRAEERSRRRRRVAPRVHAADGRQFVQLQRARISGSRDPAPRHRRTREGRLRRSARLRGRADIVGGEMGIGPSDHRDWHRHRRPADDESDAWRGHAQGTGAGRAGPRRRPQRRPGAGLTAALAVKKIMEREKLPGTLLLWPGVAEEALGSKAHFVASRSVQGCRRGALHARRQRARHQLGRRRRQRHGVGRIPCSPARAPMPPRRRGWARARSTPSS